MRTLINLLALSAAVAAVKESDLIVQTTQGLIKGHINEVGIREWKGIPYAQPPVGSLRWEYPVAPEPVTDGSIFEANVNVQGCSQTCKLPPGNCPEWGTGEDCLYMSIFAPAEPSTDPEGYPVLFWMHGGAFEQGLGNCALYNGSTFAQQGVISVVINYRLGVFGFMASKSMKGNYGLMDQRMALQWTNDNIAGFGGNAKKITIAGQSAGAMSVGSHLISPGSKGLFSASIMESNPLALPFHTRETAGNNADSVFEYVGCAADDVECMRGISVDALLEAQGSAIKLDFDTLLLNFLPWAPMVEADGEIPDQPLYALARGEFNSQPVMSGSMYDEGQLFVYELFTKPLSNAEYKVIIGGVFGKHSREILDMYPMSLVQDSTDARQVLNVLATDLLFYCPVRNITRGYQSVKGVDAAPTYVYRFPHVMSFDCWGPDYQFCVGWSCHGSELPFVFNVFTDGVSVSYDPTEDERTLTTDLGNAWTNFISSGNPNTGLALPVAYPQYVTSTDKLIVLEEPGSVQQDHVREDFCAMWDRLGYFY